MKKNKGFSLIELMVAMAIAMVALLALSALYINSKQTFNLQTMQNRISEDGRFAISMLQRVISQAGFRPTPGTLLATDRIIATSNSSISIKFNADDANQIDCNGAVAPAGDTTLVIAQSGSKLQCGSVDWIAPSASGVGNGTEVIDFKIKYGIDTADSVAGLPNTYAEYGCGDIASDSNFKIRNCVANSYVNTLSGGVTDDQIVAVKVCLVLRTEKKDQSITKGSAVNDCSGAAISNSKDDKKLYRMFRSTVLLKNW
jgi:type IV pilus assembly protein PilW